MEKSFFNNLNWHDAILNFVSIDRTNAGYNDNIELIITWQSGRSSKLIFKDVYRADISMNFGVIAEEAIRDATILEKSDDDLLNIINKWQKHYENIINIHGFEITTISTSSRLRIFAMDFIMEDITQ